MDDVVVSPLEHDGFRACWNERVGAFELWSLEGDRQLVTPRVLWTAEHVLAELAAWGFWPGSDAVITPLLDADEVLGGSVGDPFVVGDPRSGLVGLAAPGGETVEVVPMPAPVRYGPVDGGPGRIDGVVAAEVLRAVAPMSFGPPVDPARDERFRSAGFCFVTLLAAGRLELGMNVRAVQRWALEATDPTGPDPGALAARLGGEVGEVDDGAVRRAVDRLGASAEVRELRPGQRRRRRARGAGDGRGPRR
jgi:hypothetical protein